MARTRASGQDAAAVTGRKREGPRWSSISPRGRWRNGRARGRGTTPGNEAERDGDHQEDEEGLAEDGEDPTATETTKTCSAADVVGEDVEDARDAAEQRRHRELNEEEEEATRPPSPRSS